jgi:hypothetical protein
MVVEKQGEGWTDFAGMIIFVAGLLNFIAGIAALARKEYFIEGGQLFTNLQVWGWVWLVLGVLQIVTGYLIFGRKPIGRTLGLFFAGVSIAVWFVTMGAYPWWAIVVMFLDGLVIYALTVFREQFE